ncbi:MAG: ATP-binding protein [Herbinix sp.]|nr:ATP-binding protein [Herbinix sp.]
MNIIFLLNQVNYNKFFINIITIFFIIITIGIIIITLYFKKKVNGDNNELYYREELFDTIGSNEDNVFCIFDAIQKKCKYISPNFEKTLEINRDVLMHGGLEILEYIPENKRSKVLNLFSSSEDMKMLEEDFEYIKPISKRKCWIMIRVYPIYKHKSIIRYICITTDITKEKRTQKALEDALYNLQKANEAKKVFLSHMSHELKTPINGIIGMTMIASNSLDDRMKIQNYLSKINSTSKNLLTLINNILDISKIDSDKLILANEPFHLSEILKSFSAIMNTQAELNFQEYTFIMKNITEDYLLGDSLRLVQILENCVSNAIKFTPPGGKIRLEVSEVEKNIDKVHYSFVISDTGKGMREEYLTHLFVPFDQEDNSISKKYGGTGLGMTIAKELIDLMGGNIKVTSKVNVGTTITINIVFYNNPSPPKLEATKDKKINSNQYDCLGKRILIVDDNEINREITGDLLKNINLKVETATNGYEALEFFEASEEGYYDMILMDLQMPKLNGYETAKAIRSSDHPDSKEVCIIALTADDFSDNQLSLECGMDYHITKSINFDSAFTILQDIATKGKFHSDEIG